MTDQPHNPESESSDTDSPTEAATAKTSTRPDFSSGEGMVALAGIILIIEWLVLGVLINEFWVGWIILLPATAAAVLPRLNRATVEKYHPLPLIMKALGFWIAVIGAFAIIETIRFAGSRFDEPLEAIGWLVEFAAFAIAFMGARSIET